MKKTIHLHIGTHKTGSTSIQHFLRDNHSVLAERGLAVYGRDRSTFNHVELYLASQRYERDSLFKLRSGRKFGPRFTRKVTQRIADFLASVPEKQVIMSTEGLSLLRFPDEIERLREILGADDHRISIILYLRNKSDFLRSYSQQLAKISGRERSDDSQSVLYIEEDSWLMDFDTLRNQFESGFPGQVTVIDYDAEMRHRHNVLPSFLETIDIDPNTVEGFDRYFVNVSPTDIVRPETTDDTSA